MATKTQGSWKKYSRTRVIKQGFFFPFPKLTTCSFSPNIVMGANAQVALEKFARYFDVECRLVPVSVESRYRLDAKKAMEFVDENTIGVFVILGSMLVERFLCIH